MNLDLNSEELLHIQNPDHHLKSWVYDKELDENHQQWPSFVKQSFINYPFKSVRDMLEKMILVSTLPSEQITQELFEQIFDPHQSNVIMPKFLSKVSCGFTSPAEDYVEGILSLNEKFVKNPSSTFPVQAEGDCMKETIHDGDILLVDQSLEARNNQIVLAVVDGEFTMKRFILTATQVILRPDNPLFSDIIITSDTNFEIRGVVTSIHRQLV